MTDERRHQLFVAYFEANYGEAKRAEFIQDLGVSKGRVSQMLTAPFGARAGRKAAIQLGLDEEYFETDRATHAKPEPATAVEDLSPMALHLAGLFDSIPEDNPMKSVIVATVRAVAASANAPSGDADAPQSQPRVAKRVQKAGQ